MKMKRVKGAGSQAPPAPAYIAPQCGSKGVSQRGRKVPLGVGFGVADQTDGEQTAENQEVLRGCVRGRGLFARENAVDEVHIASSSRRNTMQAADCLFGPTKDVIDCKTIRRKR